MFRDGFSGFFKKFMFFPINFFSNLDDRFDNKKEVLTENRINKDKIAVLSLELERYKDLGEENSRLRELLQFKEKTNYETISAEVMGRNPNNWVGSFFINKGKNDDIIAGSAVCSSAGLLGKVIEAQDHSSTVMLITHPGFKTGGMLKKSRINGIIVGAGTNRAKILYLPVDSEISIGEEVVTSGLSSIFPKGIPIGKISSVFKSKTGLYQYAFITPAADSYTQEEVLCIKE